MRNKMIELLSNVSFGANNHTLKDHLKMSTIEEIVENLIANGATIPRWIPVSEDLPIPCETVLVAVEEKYDHEEQVDRHTDVAQYRDDGEGYIEGAWDTFNDWNEGQQQLRVTHWMPLPEPPKEEKL